VARFPGKRKVIMTDEQRKKRIEEALAAWHETKGGETLPLPWRGKQEVFPVVKLDLGVPLLNARSHRLRSQLESHEKRELVEKNPWSDEGQEVVSEIIRKSRSEKDFDRLRESLRDEDQREAGVITRPGILFNANSRLVALRDLDAADRQWLKVAVLPADASAKELAELEFELQVQEELRADYTLTNEMLFIEELSREHKMSNENIALRLRWATNDVKSKKDGAEQVAQRLRILALIRKMQKLATPPIKLTVFDGKLEQLKALEKKYNAMVGDDPEAADRFVKAWLAATLAGVDSVHDLRPVDEFFVDDFLKLRLGEQDVLRENADQLLEPPGADPAGEDLPGLDLLDPEEAQEEEDDGSSNGSADVSTIINILASEDATVKLPGSDAEVDREEVKQAIFNATKGAVDDSKVEGKTESRLEEPVNQLRRAVQAATKARDKYKDVRDSSEFKHGAFGYQLKQLKKAVEALDKLVGKETSE
jgi:hypothetical protein